MREKKYQKRYGELVKTIAPFNPEYAGPRDIFHVIRLYGYENTVVTCRDHMRRGGKNHKSLKVGDSVKVWTKDGEVITGCNSYFARVGR